MTATLKELAEFHIEKRAANIVNHQKWVQKLYAKVKIVKAKT